MITVIRLIEKTIILRYNANIKMTLHQTRKIKSIIAMAQMHMHKSNAAHDKTQHCTLLNIPVKIVCSNIVRQSGII